VDVEHPVALVDAVDGAFLDAGEVLEVNTRLRDDVGHWILSSYGSRRALPLRALVAVVLSITPYIAHCARSPRFVPARKE
jgi:hypothetical protein